MPHPRGAFGWLRDLLGAGPPQPPPPPSRPMQHDPEAIRAIATAALAGSAFADEPLLIEPLPDRDPPAWRAATATRGAGIELIIADQGGRILERSERGGR